MTADYRPNIFYSIKNCQHYFDDIDWTWFAESKLDKYYISISDYLAVYLAMIADMKSLFDNYMW